MRTREMFVEMALILFILSAFAFVHAGETVPDTLPAVLLDSMTRESFVAETQALNDHNEEDLVLQEEWAETQATQKENLYSTVVPLGVAMLIAFVFMIMRTVYLNHKWAQMHCEDGVCYRMAEE